MAYKVVAILVVVFIVYLACLYLTKFKERSKHKLLIDKILILFVGFLLLLGIFLLIREAFVFEIRLIDSRLVGVLGIMIGLFTLLGSQNISGTWKFFIGFGMFISLYLLSQVYSQQLPKEYNEAIVIENSIVIISTGIASIGSIRILCSRWKNGFK
ncbi:hypothetical protein E8L90_11030 [Brevibacillus antibioticus]|uniref:Uncharacterized protein n=1 Tax=Brevibacillus antibioticus TaxID=2570228 RepID=A0A4V5TIN7_9BACL|nr:hypothetical protein [Brevibacillus antibioticus]TKI55943.1 hypothetical protein E8L90_11030 [Brevibacillus antibioticus]